MKKRVGGNQHNPDRDELDFYPTDPRWVDVLLRHVRFEGSVREPCAGDGQIYRHLKHLGYPVYASDINPRADGVMTMNAAELPYAQNVITNPPYGKALYPILDRLLSITERKVALLVRLNFLESQLRLKYLQGSRAPSNVVVVSNRMMVFGKVSQFPHAWMVWDNELYRHGEFDTRMVVDRITGD